MDDAQIRGTAALLVSNDGHYLLHLRDNIPGICDPGTWSLIGGYRKPGEAPEETIHRELAEEASLSIPDLAPFTLIRSTAADGRPGAFIQIFRGRWNGNPADLPITEGIMFHWFAPEVVPRLRTSPWARTVIDLDQQGTAAPAR